MFYKIEFFLALSQRILLQWNVFGYKFHRTNTEIVSWVLQQIVSAPPLPPWVPVISGHPRFHCAFPAKCQRLGLAVRGLPLAAWARKARSSREFTFLDAALSQRWAGMRFLPHCQALSEALSSVGPDWYCTFFFLISHFPVSYPSFLETLPNEWPSGEWSPQGLPLGKPTEQWSLVASQQRDKEAFLKITSYLHILLFYCSADLVLCISC